MGFVDYIHALVYEKISQLAVVETRKAVATGQRLVYRDGSSPLGKPNKDVRKYFFGSSPLRPLISLCIFVRTLKKSASRFCIASADTTDRTPGRAMIQGTRIFEVRACRYIVFFCNPVVLALFARVNEIVLAAPLLWDERWMMPRDVLEKD